MTLRSVFLAVYGAALCLGGYYFGAIYGIELSEPFVIIADQCQPPI